MLPEVLPPDLIDLLFHPIHIFEVAKEPRDLVLKDSVSVFGGEQTELQIKEHSSIVYSLLYSSSPLLLTLLLIAV